LFHRQKFRLCFFYLLESATIPVKHLSLKKIFHLENGCILILFLPVSGSLLGGKEVVSAAHAFFYVSCVNFIYSGYTKRHGVSPAEISSFIAGFTVGLLTKRTGSVDSILAEHKRNEGKKSVSAAHQANNILFGRTVLC
jgi:hypothetical protein